MSAVLATAKAAPATPNLAALVVDALPFKSEQFDIGAMCRKARAEGIGEAEVRRLLRRIIEVLDFPEMRQVESAHDLRRALILAERLLIRHETDRRHVAEQLQCVHDQEHLNAIVQHLCTPQTVRLY